MRPLHLVIPTLALLLNHHAIAQASYPDRPIKMIVPLAAASAVDVAARIVTKRWPTIILVANVALIVITAYVAHFGIEALAGYGWLLASSFLFLPWYSPSALARRQWSGPALAPVWRHVHVA
ncbi:hypothetical protein IVA95_36355 [Bradyrhizobium sp. 157]|uniref:hypothetical protein n=1 Tax=Bradyrhizobium sp. 157 TaxID=2782631 RepID=UPI001FFB805F|nr:hypothetical protein [Bradyrhizobium sp. 157]MCK1642887.1 hypothetical protein [Bradyrhizobium sp. 157]